MLINGKTLLKVAAGPLILLAFYLSLWGLWVLFGLPKDQELIQIINDYFAKHGLWVLFIAALIEGALILGQYFPGGFVIFLGVISARDNIGRVVLVVAIVSLAFFIAYAINYLVGKHGWYRLLLKFGLRATLEQAQIKLQKHHLYAILASYWEPNLASITATAAGILRLPFKSFLLYSAIGIVIWNTVWGVFVHLLGQELFKFFGFKYAMIVFGIWVVILLGKYLVFDAQKTS